MNNKQLAKVLKMALPHYEAKLERDGYAFMCNEIDNLLLKSEIAVWECDRALSAIKRKIKGYKTLARYMHDTDIEISDGNKIAFYENWIAELKGEE